MGFRWLVIQRITIATIGPQESPAKTYYGLSAPETFLQESRMPAGIQRALGRSAAVDISSFMLPWWGLERLRRETAERPKIRRDLGPRTGAHGLHTAPHTAVGAAPPQVGGAAGGRTAPERALAFGRSASERMRARSGRDPLLGKP